MALFPALVLLSAFVAYLPVPDLFNQALYLMSRFVPQDDRALVRRVLADVITPNRDVFLWFGILGILWTASGGFANAFEALNIAYDVKETRSFWKTRLLAVGLTLLIGFLLFVALAVIIVGTRFGEWLAYRAHLSQVWIWVWPYIHWTLAIGFTV